jgi:hypothetical protein
MTNLQPILRDSSLMLALSLSVAAWQRGLGFAVGVAAGGALSLVNLVALAWLVARLTAHAADGSPGTALAVVGKSVVALLVCVFLMSWFEPLSVGLGIIAVVIGIVTGGLRSAHHPSRGVDMGAEEPR